MIAGACFIRSDESSVIAPFKPAGGSLGTSVPADCCDDADGHAEAEFHSEG